MINSPPSTEPPQESPKERQPETSSIPPLPEGGLSKSGTYLTKAGDKLKVMVDYFSEPDTPQK